MGLTVILLLSIALSFDTFAVALSLGIHARYIPNAIQYRYVFVIGLFHVAMCFAGWLIGSFIESIVYAYDHWIAFCLLSFIGIKMIIESWDGRGKEEEKDTCRFMNLKNTFLLGFALSIDAFIAGLTFAMVDITVLNDKTQIINVITASSIVGTIAFAATKTGLVLGSVTGEKIGSKTEILGGLILIGLGLKTLLSHLFA